MKHYEHYGINVKSFLRTDILGEDIVLPYSEELDKAVLLINELCGKEVEKLNKEQEGLMILDAYDIITNLNETQKNKISALRSLLEYKSKE